MAKRYIIGVPEEDGTLNEIVLNNEYQSPFPCDECPHNVINGGIGDCACSIVANPISNLG